MLTEDTSKNEDMQSYVERAWQANTVEKKPAASHKRFASVGGPVGNLVPFFPTDWKKNANDVFNQILMGSEP